VRQTPRRMGPHVPVASAQAPSVLPGISLMSQGIPGSRSSRPIRFQLPQYRHILRETARVLFRVWAGVAPAHYYTATEGTR
jgi:hypothetical protein